MRPPNRAQLKAVFKPSRPAVPPVFRAESKQPPQARPPAAVQLKSAVAAPPAYVPARAGNNNIAAAGPLVVQRASSSGSLFGFGAVEAKSAAKEQLMPMSCWAAAVATAAGLLNKKDYANELKIFRLGKDSGLILPSGALKDASCFAILSQSISGIKMAKYTPVEGLPRIPGWLKAGKVVLLCSDAHVVVLAGMEAGTDPNDLSKYKFRLIDPGVSGVQMVGFDILKKYNDAVVEVSGS